MTNQNFGDKKKNERKPEPVIEVPTKKDVKGRRKFKEKDKDYYRKYGSDDNWN